jgi:hypothetical protein
MTHFDVTTLIVLQKLKSGLSPQDAYLKGNKIVLLTASEFKLVQSRVHLERRKLFTTNSKATGATESL